MPQGNSRKRRDRRTRPTLLLELDRLGVVDPFRLRVDPADGDEPFVRDPQSGRRLPLDIAGVHVAGASQALLALSLRWMERAGAAIDPLCGPEAEPPVGEVRLVVARREARLLSTLLRRHLARLPQPPAWMPALQRSLEHVDEFLRWEEG